MLNTGVDSAASGDHDGDKGRLRTNLNIEQKRQFAIEWFSSGVSLRDYRSDESDVPRPFIRKAIKALHLNQLRKRRERDEDGVDELAAMKIMEFRPEAKDRHIDRSRDHEITQDRQGSKPTIEEKRQFVLEWFLSGVSLREFRPDESGIPRPFIRKAIEALDLKQLRKRSKRGEDGVNELATMKIKKFRPGKKDCRVRPDSTQTKELLLEWFDDPDMRPLVRFLRSKSLLRERDVMLSLINKNSLRQLRRKRADAGAREAALSRVSTIFECAAFKDDEAATLVDQTRSVTDGKLSLKEKKQYLLEWFLSEVDISDFRLEDRRAPRPFICKAARDLHLHQLRKKRGEDGIGEIAASRIKDYCPRNKSIQHNNTALETPQKGKMSLDEKKLCLMKWFLSELCIRDFRPGDKSVPRPFIRKGARDLHLRQLRKKRGEGGIDHIAASRIKDYRPCNRDVRSHDSVPGTGGKLEDFFSVKEKEDIVHKKRLLKLRKDPKDLVTQEQALTKIDNTDSIVEKKSVAGEAFINHEVDEGKLQGLLVEFFYDEEMSTISDFLQKKGEPELEYLMSATVKKLRLVRLRQKRIALDQKVLIDIEDLFTARKRKKVRHNKRVKVEEDSSAALN